MKRDFARGRFHTSRAQRNLNELNETWTLHGKINSILSVPWETFAENEDYRGDDPKSERPDAAAEEGRVRPRFEGTGAVLGGVDAEVAGERGVPGADRRAICSVQPAGYRQTHSAEQQRQAEAEAGRKVELAPLQKKLRQP
jgi:hypothetical protein